MAAIGAYGSIIAHQGGWDEILLVGGPIAAIMILLAVAKRRVDAQVGPVDEPHREPPGESADA
jgi:hypothetical protein